MSTYSSEQVAALTDVPYRTIMRWAKDGLLTPKCSGHGVAVTWTAKDLREARILAALRYAGFSLQKLREILGYLRSIGHNPLSTGQFLIVSGKEGKPKDIVKLCGTSEAIDLLQTPGQLVLALRMHDSDDLVISE